MRLHLCVARDENWQSGWHATGNQSISQLGYMKQYLAENDPQHHAWAKRGTDSKQLKLRILLSYWYYKNVDLDALFAKYFTEPYPDVFADSGAFSAMTQGGEVSLTDYADWVKRWKHLFAVYANLDIIKEAELTWDNQRRLEDMGLEPLPCFHILEDWKWLEQYVDQYPYIALGVAGQQTRRDSVMSWLVKCFQLAGDKSVFHGFALTAWAVMRSFRWYSVDSSSWGQGFRFGQVPLFDRSKGRFYKLGLGDYSIWRKHAKTVQEMGFDPMDFADRARNDRAKICAISALSYMMAEQWLRELHGEVRIPGRDDAPVVPRAHLVTAATNATATRGSNMSVPALAQGLEGSIAGIRLHLADTSNGINFGDAQAGTKMFLGEANASLGDIRRVQETLNEEDSSPS